MISRISLKDNEIDHLTRAAFGEEMGDRLRMLLPGKSERLPTPMMMLIEQIAANQQRPSRSNRNTEVAQ
jgi:hypothetical protein